MVENNSKDNDKVSLEKKERINKFYTAKELYDKYTSGKTYECIYSNTSLSQSIKNLKFLYKKAHNYTVSFCKKNNIDPFLINIPDITKYGYVALKLKSEIDDKDKLALVENTIIAKNGQKYYKVVLSPINVANTATVVASFNRFKRGIINDNDYVYAPEIKKISSNIEDLPLVNISQAIKLINRLKNETRNNYVAILKDVLGNLKNLTIKDTFCHEGFISYLSINDNDETSANVNICGEKCNVIKIDRICLNSVILSIISKKVFDSQDNVHLLQKYGDSLNFINRPLYVQPKKKVINKTKSEKKEKKGKKPRREWIHIIYTPMGLGKRR